MSSLKIFEICITEKGFVINDNNISEENRVFMYKKYPLIFSNIKTLSCKETKYKAFINFLEREDYTPKGSNPQFGQEYSFSNKKSGYLPIIHLGNNDIMHNKNVVSRYFRIVDSSIWNYFLQYKEEGGGVDNEKFAWIIESIRSNYDLGLYNLAIGKEYADLNFRLTKNAFLSFEHGKDVSPFLFHSEWEMKSKIYEIYEYSTEKNHKSDDANPTNKASILEEIINHRWRFLLVDDKLGDPTKPTSFLSLHLPNNEEHKKNNRRKDDILKTNTEPISNISKVDIIKYVLKKKFNEKDIVFVNEENNIKTHKNNLKETNPLITIEIVPNLKSAIAKLKKKKYEIIFLDYLLGESTLGQPSAREYGYELLEHIDSDYNKNIRNFKYGPHKKMYFMFISAFTTAVNERLLAEGFHKSTDYWHIGNGACPTNTPYLFLYNLLHLMYRRLKKTGIIMLSNRNITSIILEIFKGKNNTNDESGKKHNVRQSANEKFKDVLSLLYHYKILLEDVEEYNEENINKTSGSVLVTSFIKNNRLLGGLLEHLTQLVYLTAFGTIRQWPDMWNEYLYIRTVFETQKETSSDKETRKALLAIEKYISILKAGTL